MAPELGGRIVSLYDCKADREWLDGWQPEKRRRLWHPSDPGDYRTSPFAGADECLPTLLPCSLDGRGLPDHGELWSTQPEFSIRNNQFVCSWILQSLPLAFERTISLQGNTVTLGYRLQNLSETRTPFLWAWHPLFRLEEGDRMITGENFTTCSSPEGKTFSWPDPLPGQQLMEAKVGNAKPPCAKVFLGPLKQGHFQIQGTGSRLNIQWPAEIIPYAGIWILRGAWPDLHHWAIEPTNAPVDFLSQATQNKHTVLEKQETRTWNLTLRCL